ncbi:MAG: hypothetical protein LBP88_07480 [Treponema sp.]|jgi:hypothetical protein|nr:hypothetical protein [Treponema sp.]
MHENHLHEHPHTHCHEHPHEHSQGSHDLAQVRALMEYMLDHNQHHAGELGDMAHTLSHAGLDEAAGILLQGVEDFKQGNEQLAKALKLIQGGQP